MIRHWTRAGRTMESGFTLVELMVVVAVIGILSAIGIPKMIAYIRTASTTEPGVIMARLAMSFEGTITSKGLSMPATLPLKLAADGTGTLKAYIGESLPSGHEWKYALNVSGSKGNVVKLCMTASYVTAGADAGKYIVYSRANVPDDPAWDGHYWRVSYVSGASTDSPTLGGDCLATTATDDPKV